MSRYQVGEHLPHFCTITVLDWTPVFIEARYIDPLIESCSFCRAHKGLQLFAYVVMPNHLHAIAAAEDLPAVMRDFKRWGSGPDHQHGHDGQGVIGYARNYENRVHLPNSLAEPV